jgi:hypothetical protein
MRPVAFEAAERRTKVAQAKGSKFKYKRVLDTNLNAKETQIHAIGWAA